MSDTPLYELLPVVYRLRDAERGGPLEALVELVAGQADLLKEDLEGMWDDLFIETCEEWVVPYIGDLVANTPLYEIPGLGRRADVAEHDPLAPPQGHPDDAGRVARAVTGWGATAVAMFELLGWNQNLNHIRLLLAPDDPGGEHPLALDRVGSVDVRDRDCLDRCNTAFDQITHTVDLRSIADDQGWYGLRKVCVFCFRLQSFPMRGMTPAPSTSGGPRCYHLSPLGQDAPVFHLGVAVPDEQLASETNVDAPIRPYRFYEQPDLDWGKDRADGQTLAIETGAGLVPQASVICKDLSSWAAVPPTMVGVDVRSGRIRFGSKVEMPGPLRVDACYGFAAAIGGGPYERPPSSSASSQAPLELLIPSAYPDLEKAVAQWLAAPQDVRFVIEDSATYTLPAGLELSVSGLPEAVAVTIAAADEQRPLLVGDINVAGASVGVLGIEGLLVSGALNVSGAVEEVLISDCTLVPGIALEEDGSPQQPTAASLTCDKPADRRDVVLERSITGPLRLAGEGNRLTVRDGIVDAPAGPPTRVAIAADEAGKVAGPDSDLERVTVFGSVFVRELALASECIFTDGTLRAQRRQAGCVRFSSLVPVGSRTPRRYRCQPDLAREADPADAEREALRVRPTFTSVRYGQPGYAQLGTACVAEIREGAQDGAEMGAFQSLMQPQRETNLRVRMEEYLPFGLEWGLVHVT